MSNRDWLKISQHHTNHEQMHCLEEVDVDFPYDGERCASLGMEMARLRSDMDGYQL